ncbi:MAG TPA: V-type ATP synthase subunit E family protein [Methanospirillum sp.]|nr:V-type ATP synthase subunit E family protein [Methanospirillum sp.]
MTYEELVSSVEAAAEEKNCEILDNANREAEDLISDAEQRATEVKEKFRQVSIRSAEVERNRITYLTKEEVKASITEVKKDLFSQAFGIAELELKDIRHSSGYTDLMRALLFEAIREIGDDGSVLHIDIRDQQICEEIIAEIRIKPLILTDIECVGGLQISSSDGKIRIYNTIESRLDRVKDAYKHEIFVALAGD